MKMFPFDLRVKRLITQSWKCWRILLSLHPQITILSVELIICWLYPLQRNKTPLQSGIEGIPFGIVANLLDCHIAVSTDSSHAIAFTFRLMPLGKVLTPLYPQLWVKYYHYCPSTRMVLALNNPWRLIYL